MHVVGLHQLLQGLGNQSFIQGRIHTPPHSLTLADFISDLHVHEADRINLRDCNLGFQWPARFSVEKVV